MGLLVWLPGMCSRKNRFPKKVIFSLKYFWSLTWVRPLGGEDPLEEDMVTHSSILAWEIPWTERGAWCTIVHALSKSQTWLRTHTHTHTHTHFWSHMRPQEEPAPLRHLPFLFSLAFLPLLNCLFLRRLFRGSRVCLFFEDASSTKNNIKSVLS